ncbi:MAG: VWA domain-containing protein [Bryobacteraceae bacterium]|nr:VWA domain-containing protein [Bryobacteraceae bacterium]
MACFNAFPALQRLIAVSLALAAAAQARQEPPKPAAPVITVDVDEVVVDLIVRDRRGRLLKDLRPEEIEIFENGQRQEVRSLRLIEGPQAVLENQQRVTLDPLRQLRLVSLVFERLGPEAMRLSRDAANHLVARETDPNVYFAVFRVDPALRVLQGFTRDKGLLRKAIERATSGVGTNLRPERDEARAARTQAQAADAARAAQPPAAGQAADGANYAEQAMARALRNMEQFLEQTTREQQGSLSLTSLLALVKGQQGLAGRKTAIYFTEWFMVDEAQDTMYQTLVGEANRTNFTFYTVDAKGLTTWSQSAPSVDTLQSVNELPTGLENTATRTQETADGMKRTDRQVAATRNNPQAWLQSLAVSTGGFLVGETNDFRRPMERIIEDIYAYYEATYKPQNRNFDGKYRQLSVRLKRENAVAQSRAGYFALPPEFRDVLFPWEVPVLKMLAQPRLPRDVEFRSAMYRFGSAGGLVKHVAAVEVPLRNLEARRDEAKKTFAMHFSVLGLVKNAEGQVVRKFQRDFPLVRELDRLEGYRAGNFTFAEPMELAPGRYTLETAVMDWFSEKAGARRAALVAQAGGAPSLSSLVLIRRVEPAEGPDDGSNPFRFEKGRVVPDLEGRIAAGPNAQAGIYCLIQTVPGEPKPELRMEFSRDGQAVGQGEAPLPEPDRQGRIPYIAQIPVGGWPAGQYDVRAVLVAGGRPVAEERLAFVIE